MKRQFSASCQYTDCCSSSAAAYASARINTRMDTIITVVSIFVLLLTDLRVGFLRV